MTYTLCWETHAPSQLGLSRLGTLSLPSSTRSFNLREVMPQYAPFSLKRGTDLRINELFHLDGLNAHGHKKWIHASSASDVAADHPLFHSAEVWSPSWTICEREKCPPDIYFAIRNEKTTASKVVVFNPTMMLAVAKDQSSHLTEQGARSAETAAEIVRSVLKVRCERPWGYHPGDPNAIGDLIVSGLFKPGCQHQAPVSPSMLSGGAWETFCKAITDLPIYMDNKRASRTLGRALCRRNSLSLPFGQVVRSRSLVSRIETNPSSVIKAVAER